MDQNSEVLLLVSCYLRRHQPLIETTNAEALQPESGAGAIAVIALPQSLRRITLSHLAERCRSLWGLGGSRASDRMSGNFVSFLAAISNVSITSKAQALALVGVGRPFFACLSDAAHQANLQVIQSAQNLGRSLQINLCLAISDLDPEFLIFAGLVLSHGSLRWCNLPCC